ncbi:early nodulin-like protein 20 [Coffea arabica]|uniref:Early nodulin-like protein 20 n=1 Tax=Coffea arabica TaxID=13443 RepID=A0ABM4V862_COFAR|nr:lamin-like protein [Coffea arabica]
MWFLDGLIIMMLGKRGGALWLLVAAATLTCAASRLIQVGGKPGWRPDVNYTEWAAQQQLCVGDWLLFRFDKRMYNVLEVNRTNYELCNDHDFIQNITRGGRDVFQLTEARPYYFLCGGGYCYGGMKVAINAVEASPPAPEPTPKNGSPVTTTSSNLLALTMVSAAAAVIWCHGFPPFTVHRL